MKRIDSETSSYAKPFPNKRPTQRKSSFLLQKLLSNPHIPHHSSIPQQPNTIYPLSLHRIQQHLSLNSITFSIQLHPYHQCSPSPPKKSPNPINQQHASPPVTQHTSRCTYSSTTLSSYLAAGGSFSAIAYRSLRILPMVLGWEGGAELECCDCGKEGGLVVLF